MSKLDAYNEYVNAKDMSKKWVDDPSLKINSLAVGIDASKRITDGYSKDYSPPVEFTLALNKVLLKNHRLLFLATIEMMEQERLNRLQGAKDTYMEVLSIIETNEGIGNV